MDGGSGTAPSWVSVLNRKVTLRLATAVTAEETVRVRYRVPSSNPLRDLARNRAAALDYEAVTNETDATAAPALPVAGVGLLGLLLAALAGWQRTRATARSSVSARP